MRSVFQSWMSKLRGDHHRVLSIVASRLDYCFSHPECNECKQLTSLGVLLAGSFRHPHAEQLFERLAPGLEGTIKRLANLLILDGSAVDVISMTARMVSDKLAEDRQIAECQGKWACSNVPV